MAKLDLSTYQKQYYELVLFNGTTIHINKPSQALLIDIMAMDERTREAAEDGFKLMEIYNEIIVKILNNNKEKVEFTLDYVKENFDFEIGQIFLADYVKFVTEVNSNPNL